MKKGDKLISKENIKTHLGALIFKKSAVYEVLYVDNENTQVYICLNHEKSEHEDYNKFPIDWIHKNFTKHDQG